MPEETIEYKKLPRVRKLLVRQKIWQGPDHLLSVSSGTFRETNRRFYYSDIQAITIEATDTGKYINVSLGFIIALFGILLFFPALVTGSDTAFFFRFLLGIVFVPSVILLIANLAYGKTCTCRIHTAVQIERLRDLSRIRTATKFVNKVIPLIEQSQGSITPETLGANAEELHRFQASQHADVSKSQENRAEIHHEKGLFHLITFLILLYFALGSFYDALYSIDLKNIIDSILLLTVFVINIMAIMRQANSDLPSSLRILTWSSLIFNSVYIFIYIMFISIWTALSFDQATTIDAEQMREYPLFTNTMLFVGIIYLVLSVPGLVIVARFRAAYQDALALAQTQADVQADMQTIDDAAKGP